MTYGEELDRASAARDATDALGLSDQVVELARGQLNTDTRRNGRYEIAPTKGYTDLVAILVTIYDPDDLWDDEDTYWMARHALGEEVWERIEGGWYLEGRAEGTAPKTRYQRDHGDG